MKKITLVVTLAALAVALTLIVAHHSKIIPGDVLLPQSAMPNNIAECRSQMAQMQEVIGQMQEKIDTLEEEAIPQDQPMPLTKHWISASTGHYFGDEKLRRAALENSSAPAATT